MPYGVSTQHFSWVRTKTIYFFLMTSHTIKTMHQNLVKQSVFNRLLRHVDVEFPVSHRKRKASNAEVLLQVLRVLRYGVPWKDTADKCSYQAIYKRFRCWTRHDTFGRLWRKTVKRYADEKIRRDPQWFQHIFLDCTLIKNNGVTECKGRNPTDRGRSGTKLSAVCDRERQIVGIVPAPANVGDSLLATSTLSAIPFDLRSDKRRRINIIADKGYSYRKVSEKVRKVDRRFVLITQKHKKHRRFPNNQCMTSDANSMLKGRHVIENSFADIKKFKRIRTRDDSHTDNFCSFIFLSLALRTISRFERSD